MKNNRGKWLIGILIFFSISLAYGDGFDYNITVDKKTPYVKEAVILTLNIKQTDLSKVMLFKFTPRKSPDYQFIRIDAKEKDMYQNAKVRYTYLVYPLKDGEISISFELIQKTTNAQSLAYSYSGDKENTKVLTTDDTLISLAPLKLQVKPLPKDTLLVGDFTLTHKIKTDKVKAFEPISLSIEIKGNGYLPKIDDIIKSDKDYTLFQEEPQVNSVKNDHTMFHTVTYLLALSAKQNFTLPQIDLKAFNPATEQSYTLKIPKQAFTVTPVEDEVLLDKVDSPMPLQKTDWSWLTTLLGYIVVFIAGVLTAKSVQWHKKEKIKTDPLLMRIAQTDDPKALLTLLMAEDSKKYARIIEKLDAHIYGNKPLNLKEIKKELNA